MDHMVRSVRKIATNVSMDINRKYEVWQKIQEAVKCLNTLQSNAQALQKIRQDRNKHSHLNVPNMVKYAERVGISLKDIDSLNVIHVSGTKGKGSTCAFTESILNQYGYSTGFFSSPHLVEVRERFRINGTPLSREKFASYFWDVYTKLEATKDQHDGAMPAYFAFCTIMAFHVFLQEKTDVAIIEVGIGGMYDSTNVIHNPVVCGVTSLGLDHTSILGNTIDKIAWHKAGIFKPGVPAFTAPQVLPALQVLKERAEEVGNSLHKVSPLQKLDNHGRKFDLGIEGAMQKVNAALALQLSNTWMEARGNKKVLQNGVCDFTENGSNEAIPHLPDCDLIPLTEQSCLGLARCNWAGRNQAIRKHRLTYYLDGAHTLESVQQCIDWFQETSAKEASTIRGNVVKVIVFNTTGDRDPSILIAPLIGCQFDLVAFCPNIAFSVLDSNSADLNNKTVTTESQHSRCVENKESWTRVYRSRTPGGHSSVVIQNGDSADVQMDGLETVKDDSLDKVLHPQILNSIPSPLFSGPNAHGDSQSDFSSHISCNHSNCDNQSDLISCVFPSIYDALRWATQGRDPLLQDEVKIDLRNIPEDLRDPAHVQVLVTGSLHLIGGVLRVISPDFNS